MQISISTQTDITLPPETSPEVMASVERMMRNLGRVAAPEPVTIATAALDVTSTESPAGTDLLAIPPVGHGEYWASQGGHYICTLPALHGLPARHLILGTEENQCTWGRGGEDIPGAASQYDGKANTAALVAHGGHLAAEWAASYEAAGHKDWFLASRFELLMCHLAAPQLFQKDGWYWSSSQCSRRYAWCQDFEHGNSYGNAKDNEFRARPVRTIQL